MFQVSNLLRRFCVYVPWSYRVVVVVLTIIQEVNGADSVHGFAVPSLISHPIHKALQSSKAGQVVITWSVFCFFLRNKIFCLSKALTERKMTSKNSNSKLKEVISAVDMLVTIRSQLNKWELSHTRLLIRERLKLPDHSFKSQLSQRLTATWSPAPNRSLTQLTVSL